MKKAKLISGVMATLSIASVMGTTALAADATLRLPTSSVTADQSSSKMTDEMRKNIHTVMQESQKNALNELVKAGTITQIQMDKILAHDRSVFDGLTQEQKEKLKIAMVQAYKNALDKLVKDGTLTREQADRMITGRDSRQRQNSSNSQ